MAIALRLARRALGTAWPNPAVGCVIVAGRGAEARVVGRGWTRPGGRPHAETEALRRAGEAARGATAFVTLEPCTHTGKTPPCTDALKAAGIARVVAAMVDPDNRVSGRGLKALEAAGIAVECGLGGAEAAEINAGYILHRTLGRPLVTLKLATTLDGRIATHRGESRWITGDSARAAAHLLRARHDAIMVGIGTALSDNPSLTCRLGGMDAYSPVRIVADSSLRLPLSSTLVETAGKVPTWIVCSTDADENTANALIKKNVHIVRVEASSAGRPRPEAIAQAIGERGLTRVLIEGGGKLAGEFLHADLVDHLAWYHAPMLIGGDGIPSAAAFGVEKLGKAPAYVRSGLELVGRDLYETYQRDDGKKT